MAKDPNFRHIALDSWPRREHFEFFSAMEEPFWGMTTEVDVTHAFAKSSSGDSRPEGERSGKAKTTKTSFFSLYLHAVLTAVNATENFRYRINEKNEVIAYDTINASATVMRKNETFGFTWIPYETALTDFAQNVKEEIDRVQREPQLFPAINGLDCIHFSAIPWLSFTSLSHARSFKRKDSVPKISVGKVQNKEGKKRMPISIHVHHGLVDGLHVGRFLERLQELLHQ